MSDAASERPRTTDPPRRGRRLLIGGTAALLSVAAVGLGLYWYEWKTAREGWRVEARMEPYGKVRAAFLEDIEAGRVDTAYDATTDAFKGRVGREEFEARAGRYRAFKQRPGIRPDEAGASGPGGGGDPRTTNQMMTRDTWADADGRRLRVSVTVVQEADSFFYRRPPPLRVGEFTADELPPAAPGKP
jgi:hypothetical protein